MTIDEAIKNREDCLKYLEGIGPKASPKCLEAVRWSVKALKALRPISREQVEKVWRAHWNESVHLGGFVYCSRCGYNALEANNYTFCPKCGSPLRPGAKFCTSCGNRLASGTDTGDAARTSAAAPAPKAENREPLS